MPYAFTTREIEYVRHGATGYMAKLYIPSGDGPFPMVIDLHGGAWGKGSLEECKARDEVLARSGLLVAGLAPDGAAQKGGLFIGDVIVAVNGQPLRHADALQDRLSELAAGSTVKLGLVRGGQPLQVEVVSGGR